MYVFDCKLKKTCKLCFLGVGWSRRDVAAMEMFPQKRAYENGAFDPTEEVRPNETDQSDRHSVRTFDAHVSSN